MQGRDTERRRVTASQKSAPKPSSRPPLERDLLGKGSPSGRGSAEFEYRVLLTNQGPNIIHETRQGGRQDGWLQMRRVGHPWPTERLSRPQQIARGPTGLVPAMGFGVRFTCKLWGRSFRHLGLRSRVRPVLQSMVH